ncbi:MAG TPA: RNA-binding domain-containing protein [Methanomassiliicoccales archaeon]|nr:RNA-binding domain-containing protein [Methanomassiliicoccales archaeon]
MVEVVASASSYPTEDVERVRRCLLNIFPEAELREEEGKVRAATGDLSRFKELIRNHRILDSTRAVLLRGMTDDEIIFRLNKQAAFVGKISFVEGNAPLGHIEVIISGDELEALIDDVAPRTVDGEIP